jgi:DNA-binding MarR family transcriptional regulator
VIIIIVNLIISNFINMTMQKEPSRRSASPPNVPMPTQFVTFEPGVPPVARIPIALARRFTQICIASLAEVVAAADLTPMQYALLPNLRDQPEMDQNSLAARLGVDRNSTSVLVQQLVTRGLVERHVSEADRRARLLRLTPKGERIHTKLAPAAVASQQRILEILTPKERELLLDLLLRVIEANRALARPGAGRRKRARKTAGELPQ